MLPPNLDSCKRVSLHVEAVSDSSPLFFLPLLAVHVQWLYLLVVLGTKLTKGLQTYSKDVFT